jgi:hypothetical protein
MLPDTSALDEALVATSLEFATNQRSLIVDRAGHAAPVERGAPAIRQPRHGPAAPLVDPDQRLRHARVSEQQYFKAAAACMARRATDFIFRIMVWHVKENRFNRRDHADCESISQQTAVFR